MKKLYNYLLIGVFAILVISCVDDFEDANPPRLLDAPELTGTQSADTVSGGDEVSFTLVVSDAPAGIDSVSVAGPDDAPIFTSNVAGLLGQTKGTVEVKYTVPYTVVGGFEVTVSVWDSQTDSKGKDASKRFDETFGLVAKYAFDAPTFSVSTNDAALDHNDSTKVTINITSAPAGIGQVLAFSSLGTITLSEEDIVAAEGNESGIITGMLYAPEKEVGTATISVSVIDKLQKRESKGSSTVDINYVCTAPDFSITNVSDVNTTLNGSVDFDLEINSITTCGIDTITLELIDDTGAELGELTYSNDKLDSLIAGTLVSMPVVYDAPANERGVVDVVITVIDEDYHASEEKLQITIIGCSAPDISGTYDAVSSGTSTDGCPANNPLAGFVGTVTLSAAGSGNYTIDDAFSGVYIEWYGSCYGYTFKTPATINFCTQAQGLSLVTFTDAFDATVSDTGSSYDAGTGVITYSWENSFGDVATTVLTPQ
ncbi:hypothetical protein JMN32_16270 [Fulvivirga sp. 29W222]|uniref:Uncharacterized protein n=1 Tax=Fulvivirga marina TaxID=2494733 RepID=A0A937FZI0_9BACT|nr:hypothetical protein [Fulvivirga marina]MBL6447877.1 hypothetical protein [Fulvivirga marina]